MTVFWTLFSGILTLLGIALLLLGPALAYAAGDDPNGDEGVVSAVVACLVTQWTGAALIAIGVSLAIWAIAQ